MNVLTKVALRGGLPLAAMTGIAAILRAQNESADARSTLAAGLIAAAVSGASVIYEVDSWSLRRQSAVHLAVMVATVLPILVLSGWFRLQSVADYALLLGAFAAVGIVLWTVAYLVFGRLVPRHRSRGR